MIGLGLMGSGIAELVARSGRRVVAIEINQDFLDQGMARLHASLDKAVSRGKLTDTAREEILTRIRPTDDIAAGVANADLVIEAIPERMDLKRTLYAQLDAGLPGRCDPGHQHLLAVGHRDRRRHAVSRPGRGAALLQSRAGHEAGRGHLHGAHLAGDQPRRWPCWPRDLGKTPGPGQRPGRVHRQRAAGALPQPRNPAAGNRPGHPRGHRHGGHRGARPADGTDDPARPDRPGHGSGGPGGAPG